MDQLYLRGEVRPFHRIFGWEEPETRREPVIIPFRRHHNSELEETKHEVDPKQEAEDEEHGNTDLSEGPEDDNDDDEEYDGDNYMSGGSEEEGQKKAEVKNKIKKAFCLQCNKGYKNSFSLKRHMKLHEIWIKKDEEKGKEPPELIACSDCSYKARNKDLMKRHWRAKHDTSARVVSCKVCSYSTRRIGDLRRHFRRVHQVSPVRLISFVKTFFADV